MSLPPLGNRDLSVRACTRDVDWPNEKLCGKEPFLHVIWAWGDGGAAGFVCESHTRELTATGWRPVAQHELGPECGMPGALWDETNNVCVTPEPVSDTVPDAALAAS